MVDTARIEKYRNEYRAHIVRDARLQKAAKLAVALGAGYALYWTGSGVYNWLTGKSEVTQAVVEHSKEWCVKEILELKKNIPQSSGFITSNIKSIGTLIASTYILGAAQGVMRFATSTIYEVQLRALDNELQQTLLLLDYGLEQLSFGKELPAPMYENYQKIIVPLVTRVLQLGERSIGVIGAVVECLPPTLAQEQKLDSVAAYLTSLLELTAKDINANMEGLLISPSASIALIKSRIELLKNEFVVVKTRLVLASQIL